MDTVCELNKCNGCSVCVEKCPKKCIKIIDEKEYLNAVRDLSACINCHICENICPRNNQPSKAFPLRWHQGWCDEELRKSSSSGGAAAALTNQFIKNGGYVAACCFSNGRFSFDITNDLTIAKKFAGSKYVKSDLSGIISRIEERLKTNPVLFIGLPCQAAAIKNAIKNQENLYIVDLICHGTPSVKMLDAFLYEKGIEISNLKSMQFREKNKYGILVNGEPLCPEGTDDYMISFLAAINYTENCYYCSYASFDRVSDITLGDSWGTELMEELKNGISLILVQSAKGEKLLAGSNIKLLEVNIEKARSSNEQLNHPCEIPMKRKQFFNNLKQGRSYSLSVFIAFKKKIFKRFIKKCVFRCLPK